ncbi:MAG: nucleotidyl transferase AbiEii/AbiGii toxin family protein [Paludibacteraceae bacterium]|nr:nucleotidyl transferase AbiEii/AbiGii toxin family protein [Paludibacteraceae bacterium]
MNAPQMEHFRLVGGTALALQLGHRISVDLDLFSQTPFDAQQLQENLEINHLLQTDYLAKGTVKGEINGVQIDCIEHNYPWIKPLVEEDGIRLASLEDISAMKLNAIAGNGTRIKDFIDVAELSSVFSLNQMLNFYEQKYNANILIPLKAIIYFDDINKSEPIKMADGKQLKWEKYQKRLLSMEKFPNKVFGKI